MTIFETNNEHTLILEHVASVSKIKNGYFDVTMSSGDLFRFSEHEIKMPIKAYRDLLIELIKTVGK